MKNLLISIFKCLIRSRFFTLAIGVCLCMIIVSNISRNKTNNDSSVKREKIPTERGRNDLVSDQVEFDNKEPQPAKADSLVDYAHTLHGVPYKWAGKTPLGFDCSGFIFHVFNKFGVDVPAGSANLFTLGEVVPKDELTKGDLVFFTGTQVNKREVGHVGIVISEPGDKPQFIHSSSGGGGRGVTINDLEHPHYEARYLGARRIGLM